MKKKYIYILIILIILFFLYYIVSNKNIKYSKNMFYMDTYINIKIYSDKNKKYIDKIYNEVDKIYDKYDRLANAYVEYENIINIYYLNNILENNKEIEIDDDLSNLILYGISFYDKTSGLFNIALGNVTGMWKKYMNEGKSIPSYDELSRMNININDIKLENNKYTKYNNIKIDLGAIAKGYVTELVGKYLEENGIDKYLINAGGNVKVGKHYKNNKYIIGIEDPIDTNNIYRTIKLENKSVVTSGDYQRYYEVDNVRYNHIINPKTLYPSDYYKSVTVIANDSGYADMMSTYLFIIPIEEALEMVNNTDDLEAIFYIDNDNIIKSKGFSNYE